MSTSVRVELECMRQELCAMRYGARAGNRLGGQHGGAGKGGYGAVASVP
jgi:hypothetical protein